MFARAAKFGWQLRAWAVLSSHYHVVAAAPPEPDMLRCSLWILHMAAAMQLNKSGGAAGRRMVWAWDSHITFEASYLADKLDVLDDA